MSMIEFGDEREWVGRDEAEEGGFLGSESGLRMKHP